MGRAGGGLQHLLPTGSCRVVLCCSVLALPLQNIYIRGGDSRRKLFLSSTVVSRRFCFFPFTAILHKARPAAAWYAYRFIKKSTQPDLGPLLLAHTCASEAEWGTLGIVGGEHFFLFYFYSSLQTSRGTAERQLDTTRGNSLL